ncbi:aldo/keto reductase [Ruminococcus sp.]|uniref:aldo/keto reductase n=1 Tax=Ruminococcus sp. TaxID=41978 RepID=UPI0025FDC2F8|nr:aldo/keto reductase [Ruminococcus sp.]MBQ8966104.1 aldo/keto reductase [Ruminococcus sp.]
MEYLTHRGEKLPLIGFGTYRLGEREPAEEADTLRYGIEKLGMTLIDTAEMYGSGLSEELLRPVIKGYDRSLLFIIDKILPENAEKGLYRECCQRSLERLGTDCIDLYLLHWRGGVDMQDMVDNMEILVRDGLIRHWGVSNFDTHEMEELLACKNGANCFCDQILYNLTERGAEYDLIPLCREHDVLVIAYSPLCNCCSARMAAAGDEVVKAMAEREGKTPESLMLSFAVRQRDMVTIFKTSGIPHLLWDMQNVFLPIPEGDMAALSARFAPPEKKYPLEKI